MEERCRRFLKENVPRRIGALAANLGRISSFSKNEKCIDVVKSLVEESEYFIEWTCLDVPLEMQEGLVELQIRLAQWKYRLSHGIIKPSEIAQESKEWSDRLLEKVIDEL